MNQKSEAGFNFKQDLVNKITEAAISSQVESASNLDVNLNSDLSQIVQGKADSLKIRGEKIIAFKDIQLEQIDITCEDLSLNLTQAVLGKISFEQPGNFQVKLIFTESDCDRLLNSEYVRVLLQSLPLAINQQPAKFQIEEAKSGLDHDGKITLTATIVLDRETQLKTAKFQIAFQLQQQGAVIKFGGGQYLEDQALDLNETVAIMNKISDLLYLRRFSNSDLSFDITNIIIKDQQLILLGNAQIKKLPDSINQSIKSVASQINQD